MRKALVLPLFLLLALLPLTSAQGFAISYPPGLKELKIPVNETYTFDVTLINSLDAMLEVTVEAAGENVVVLAPLSVSIPAKSSQKVHVTLKAPDNVTGAEFSGYVRFIVSVPGLGGKVAGSVTVPVAGEWEGLPAGGGWSTTTTENSTTQEGVVTTLTRNENLTEENPASTLQNTTEITEENDPISALLAKYSSENDENLGIEASGLQVNNESNTTVGLEKEAPTSTLPVPRVGENPPKTSPNIGLYFVGAVIVGLILSRFVRREYDDEEGHADDFTNGYGY